MIDWVKVKIKIRHEPIKSGAFLSINPQGEIEKESLKSIQVEGSYSQKIIVRSVGSDGNGKAEYLECCGNPAKFIQGHNVFGSDDLKALVKEMARILFKALNLEPTEEEQLELDFGDSYLNWVDINYPFELSCQSDVRAWIRAAEFKSRTRSGRPSTKGSTIYWQKHSRRFALKAYSKFDELNSSKKHRLPPELQNTRLMEWTENILRIELRLLGKELRKLNINKVNHLPPERVKNIFGEYMKKITLTEQIKLSSQKLMELPNAVRSTYLLWSQGMYPYDILARPTFYRHRKLLLEHGIDISIAVEKDSSNVIPLVRVLDAKPAKIPDWAYEQGLIYISGEAA